VQHQFSHAMLSRFDRVVNVVLLPARFSEARFERFSSQLHHGQLYYVNLGRAIRLKAL